MNIFVVKTRKICTMRSKVSDLLCRGVCRCTWTWLDLRIPITWISACNSEKHTLKFSLSVSWTRRFLLCWMRYIQIYITSEIERFSVPQETFKRLLSSGYTAVKVIWSRISSGRTCGADKCLQSNVRDTVVCIRYCNPLLSQWQILWHATWASITNNNNRTEIDWPPQYQQPSCSQLSISKPYRVPVQQLLLVLLPSDQTMSVNRVSMRCWINSTYLYLLVHQTL